MLNFDSQNWIFQRLGVPVGGRMRDNLEDAVDSVAEKVDRCLNGDEFTQFPGSRGVGDLKAYWSAVFGRDIHEVIKELVTAVYPADERAYGIEDWTYGLRFRTTELLSYGVCKDVSFLERADSAVEEYSKPLFIVSPDEVTLGIDPALRRLAKIEELFKNYPYPTDTMKAVHVDTPEFGVVTLTKYNLTDHPENDAYEVGINNHTVKWPSIGVLFDELGEAGPLRTMSAVNILARFRPGVTPPTADQLCNAVFQTLSAHPEKMTAERPTVPNLTLFE